jgi:hypothetical protein
MEVINEKISICYEKILHFFRDFARKKGLFSRAHQAQRHRGTKAQSEKGKIIISDKHVGPKIALSAYNTSSII